MKKKLYIALACLLLCAGVLAALYATSPLNKEPYRGGFARSFAKAPLKKLSAVDLGVNSYYIAGADDETIYFANFTQPAHMLTTNYNLADTQYYRIRIKLDSIMQPRAFRTVVDSPYFYMLHGQMPEYLRGRLDGWIANRYLEKTPDYSVEAVPVDSNTVILKSISKTTQQYELGIKTTTAGLKFNDGILKKQKDGIFCLEGKLLYDDKYNIIVYAHQYRNEIIVLDSLLNIIYRSHTLDTISHAHITAVNLSGDHILSRPPTVVNVTTEVNNGLLFVRSNILANNQDAVEFRSNTTIDVYDLLNRCHYITSFYIPTVNKKHVTSYRIVNDNLIVVSDDHAIIYTIPEDITQYLKTRSTTINDISRAKSGSAEHLQKK